MRIFEIIGPPMIGPSSSHTAGACRIGFAAGKLLDEPVQQARIELHGSFLATGEGHGTHEAIVAGLLGMTPDDESLIHAIAKAKRRKIGITFEPVDLGPQAHPNSARIHLSGAMRTLTVTAASVGAGNILIQEIDSMPTEIDGTLQTLVLWHEDLPGFLARVTAILACVDLNVATIRTSRLGRGKKAITAVEVDGEIPPEVSALLIKTSFIHRQVTLPVLPGY